MKVKLIEIIDEQTSLVENKKGIQFKKSSRWLFEDIESARRSSKAWESARKKSKRR